MTREEEIKLLERKIELLKELRSLETQPVYVPYPVYPQYPYYPRPYDTWYPTVTYSSGTASTCHIPSCTSTTCVDNGDTQFSYTGN